MHLAQVAADPKPVKRKSGGKARRHHDVQERRNIGEKAGQRDRDRIIAVDKVHVVENQYRRSRQPSFDGVGQLLYRRAEVLRLAEQ